MGERRHTERDARVCDFKAKEDSFIMTELRSRNRDFFNLSEFIRGL